MSHSRVLLWIILVAIWGCTNIVFSERPSTTPIVLVNKCCRLNEFYHDNQCTVGATKMWQPIIYRTRYNVIFSPDGDGPKFIRYVESKFPTACENPEFLEGRSRAILFTNGSLYLKEWNKMLSHDEFCVDQNVSFVCRTPQYSGDANSLMAPRKLATVRKCCGIRLVYSTQETNCIVQDATHGITENVVNSSEVELMYGFPMCKDTNSYAIASKFNADQLNATTGGLILENGKHFAADEYCLEHVVDAVVDNYINVFACAEHYSVPPHDVEKVATGEIQFILYSIGLFISVIFLTATLATGFLLPSNHHVLHWRCQTYYVGCLLVGDLILAITQVSGKNIAGPTCIGMATAMHFFFLAAFFWLNTMCFNIWWTFRDFRPTSLEKGQEIFRLRLYSVYAWGGPMVIAGLGAILDNIPVTPGDTFLRPNFGEKRCWFSGDMEILTYFFGPIGILLGVNLLLFALTARQLTCGLWKRDDVKSTTERAALGRVCLKLVVVMGVTWVADVISWAVGGPDYVWYVTDVVNLLQGIFIFIVVGCQPQVWAAVKRLWNTHSGRSAITTTHGPQHSSSSHGLPSIGESVTNNTFTNTTSTKVPMETIC